MKGVYVCQYNIIENCLLKQPLGDNTLLKLLAMSMGQHFFVFFGGVLAVDERREGGLLTTSIP